MGRPLIQRLLVLLAFATALLSTSAARATLVPACESHQITRMPVEWLVDREPTPDACTSGERVGDVGERLGNADELADSRVAAMCDERGASAVAPSLVRPIVDARIDAIPGGCSIDITNAAPVARRGSEHAPLGAQAFALAQGAMIDAQALVPPASSEFAPPYPAAPGQGRAGIRRGIDHPPR